MFRLDFTSQDYLRDPANGLAKLRAAGPVVKVRFPIIGKTWITTTSDLAGRVLKDNETFTMRNNGNVAGFAGGCQAGYARSRSACCPWTNRTIRVRAAWSTKLSPARHPRDGT
jgi:predicted oxidoreductase